MAPLSYPLFFSVNTVPVIPITIWVKETTNFCISLRVYLWKMPCGKGWKWHCRETKFRNFLEEHPSLKCLQHSNFSSRAYTFKISWARPWIRIVNWMDCFVASYENRLIVRRQWFACVLNRMKRFAFKLREIVQPILHHSLLISLLRFEIALNASVFFFSFGRSRKQFLVTEPNKCLRSRLLIWLVNLQYVFPFLLAGPNKHETVW